MADCLVVIKMRFWMIQYAKEEFLGLFLELNLLDGLDIADFDRTKWFLSFGDDKRPCIIDEACIISINYAKKG